MYEIQKRIRNFLSSEEVTTAHIGQQASVLTLATLFALVPLISGLAWLLSQIPTYQFQIVEQFEQFLSYMVPDQAIIWRTRVDGWTQDAHSLKSVSAVMFFASTFFLVNQIDRSLHFVFQIDGRRGSVRWLHYLWVMPVLMGLLMLSVVLVMMLQIALGTGLLVLLPGVHLTSIPVMWLLLWAVYQFASRGSVSRRANLLVSLLVTFAFYVLKTVFAWLYINLPNWSLIFGVFSAIPLFLLWCQTAWSLLLYGALILRWLSPAKG